MAELEEEAEFWLPSGVLSDDFLPGGDLTTSSESGDDDDLLSFEALSIKSTEGMAGGSPESTLWEGWSSGSSSQSPSSLSSSPLSSSMELLGGENNRSRGVLRCPELPPAFNANDQRKFCRPPPRRPWAGHSGMRAVFLNHSSGRETAGTGVFFPRTDGAAEPRKKPGCSTVLFPARVVQALNLDLKEIAAKSKLPIVSEIGGEEASKKEMGRSRASARRQPPPPARSELLSDVRLPPEWTY
ncbi:uncharacterized protein LOC144707179 [Wolffia australiana]